LQKLYAKAIYDNYADTPDELPFKKGDILTVIEQDTEGIQGWWLCSLRNRQVSWVLGSEIFAGERKNPNQGISRH